MGNKPGAESPTTLQRPTQETTTMIPRQMESEPVNYLDVIDFFDLLETTRKAQMDKEMEEEEEE